MLKVIALVFFCSLQSREVTTVEITTHYRIPFFSRMCTRDGAEVCTERALVASNVWGYRYTFIAIMQRPKAATAFNALPKCGVLFSAMEFYLFLIDSNYNRMYGDKIVDLLMRCACKAIVTGVHMLLHVNQFAVIVTVYEFGKFSAAHCWCCAYMHTNFARQAD